MCKAIHQGGTRCKGCGYSAKVNGNRRSNRVARRKLTEYLIANGLPETAKAVLHAPPSLVPVIMANLDLDTAEILGDTPPPSAAKLTDELKQQADELTQMCAQEMSGTLTSVSDVDAAIAAAEEKVAEAEKHEDDLRKAANRATTKRRKAKKAFEEASVAYDAGEIDLDELEAARAPYQEALNAENAAKADYVQAQEDTKVARTAVVADVYELKKKSLSEEEFGEYCSELSDEELQAISDSVHHKSLALVQDASKGSVDPQILAEARDLSVYTPGDVTLISGGDTITTEGRLLDGGVAIVRHGYSDFSVLVDPSGEGVYHLVAAANGKQDALSKANRITRFAAIPPVTADADELVKQAAAYKRDALIASLSEQANDNKWSGANIDVQGNLSTRLSGVTDRLAGDHVDAELADIQKARRAHAQRLRLQAARDNGEAARNEALTAGLSAADAQKAYDKAYRASLGKETLRGGVIPHFEHKIPPDSIGEHQYTKLGHSGIRSFGAETASDYAVISDWGGDLKKWGFTASGSSNVKLADISELTVKTNKFVNQTLASNEKQAFITYTGGNYQAINAAYTGRDASPSASVRATVSHLEAGFERYTKEAPFQEPINLARGTKVPSGWKGTPEEYLEAVFKPGEKVQIGKVTSASTDMGVAKKFMSPPPYMMVIRTRTGIPVKSISQVSHEDEVIVPPGTDLRCVRIDKSGLYGKPTVYLVAEDLVAEAQDGISPTGGHFHSKAA